MPKWCPEVSSGKCQNHGRGCTGDIWGGLGEALGGDFFQAASPDPLWRGPGMPPGADLADLGSVLGSMWGVILAHFRICCDSFLEPEKG